MNKKNLFFIIIVIALLISVFIGQKSSFFKKIIKTPTPSCEDVFKLLNPEISCDFSEEKHLEIIEGLQTKINDYITLSKTEKVVSRVSVFFRDLSSKKWIGINQNEDYAPASMLKLPLLMSYFKLSEIDPTMLSKKYAFKKVSPILDQNFQPSVELEEGKEYTIEELLRQMIIYSDNDAMNFLLQIIVQNFVIEQYYQMGVPLPVNDNTEEYVSTISYSNILRMLYNSSYLTRKSSQKIIEWLIASDFKQGLSAGLPSGVPVGHKFGERTIGTSVKELHDCGIVYYPNHPYILCVMTSGDSFENLEKVISSISGIVYKGIDEEAKNSNNN